MTSRIPPKESVYRSIQQQYFCSMSVARNNFISSTKDSLDYIERLGLQSRLEVHSGCVNTIHWNDNGDYILSGSDDQCIAVTNPHTQKLLLKYKTGHRANIFSARFMPQSNDQSIVSCSGDGIVLHTHLYESCIRRCMSRDGAGFGTSGYSTVDNGNLRPTYQSDRMHLQFFNCHKTSTTYDVLTIPYEPRCFMSCGEDGTVRLFDLRQISSCHKTCCKDNILIFSPSAVNAMDLAPINSNYLAVGSSDAVVRIFDRRYLSLIDFRDPSIPTKERHTRPVKAFAIPLPTKRHYRVTCVKYSPDESELLVSYSSEYLYLFDLKSDGINVEELHTKGRYIETLDSSSSPPPLTPEQVTRRLRLRGDWSDTGPDARPESDPLTNAVSQARPQLHATLMRSMTDAIARMLNDPRTRSGIAGQVQEAEQRRVASNEGTAPATSSWRSATVRSIFRLRSTSAETTPSNPPCESVETASTSTGAGNDVRNGVTTISNSNNTQEMETNDSSTEGSHRRSSLGNSRRHFSSDDEDDEENTTSLNEELAELDMRAQNAADKVLNDEVGELMTFDYVRMKFTGHRNARTMIKEANFWGNNYVMCGSDCGHIFIWDRKTGKLVKLIQGDQHVVNCLQPHPELPYLASSGIDYDVKIWAPILEKSDFDEEKAESLMKRNAVMLEQTKDTITVPAAFMIRMLACIHSLRNRERPNNSTNSNSNSNNDNGDSGSSTGVVTNNNSNNNDNNSNNDTDSATDSNNASNNCN